MMTSQQSQQIFEWISAIIDSCTDDFHFEAVDKLIELFHEKDKTPELNDLLKYRRAKKWNEIHTILK